MQNQELHLLRLVNKVASDPVANQQDHLKKIGEHVPEIELNELLQLYIRRDALLFHQRNPNLSPKEIIEIQNLITEYLEASTYTQHLQRFIAKADLIKDALHNNAPYHETKELIKQFASQAESKRTYDVSKHPEYLVLEHYMNILMRKEQVDNLDLLKIKNGVIHNPKAIGFALEMIMGSGKSSVLLPLLGLMNADGEHLSLGIIPDALLPTLAPQLSHLVGPSFKQSIQVLAFDRSTSFTQVKLQQTKDQLEQMKNDRQMLLMTPSSIQSLFLSFLEHVFFHSEKTEEITLFREIFRTFRHQGRALIDEIDTILNALKEHHFALGLAKPIDPKEFSLMLKFYELLADHESFKELGKFEFLTHDKDQPLTEKVYRENIVPQLVEMILEKHLGNSDSLKSFFDNLPINKLESLKIYLSLHPQIQELSLIQEKAYQDVKDLDDEMKNLLALAREEIHILLPLTGFKICDVNYGNIDEKPFSIPFEGSDNPKRRAQFGNAYETGNMSIQSALKKGISPVLLKKELLSLQKRALQEIQANPEMVFEDTLAYQEFMVICGNDKNYRLFMSNLTVDQMVEKLLEKVNSDLKLKMNFVKKIHSPHHTHPPSYINNKPSTI